MRQDKCEFLQRLKSILDAIPVPTKLVEPTEAGNVPSLLAGFDSVGENDGFVQMEFDFVTDKNAFTHDYVAILQTFAAIHPAVEQAALSDLQWLVGQINAVMPLGFFGIMEQERTLYLKANAMLIGPLLTEQQLNLVDQQTGVLFYEINLFYELLCTVAEGAVQAKEAWKNFDFALP